METVIMKNMEELTILIAVCSTFQPQSQRVALVSPSRVDSDGSAASGDSFAPSNWVPFRQLKQSFEKKTKYFKRNPAFVLFSHFPHLSLPQFFKRNLGLILICKPTSVYNLSRNSVRHIR
jgi:hypothetical protein